ncbi:MAG TPA: family 20 glycosylhydrolase [Chitinophagaceae bacterium]|nr:family 20 glycosylhydrolase [Chitinophagaceae bacterium]
MKKLLAASFLLQTCLMLFAQTSSSINLIPLPVSVTPKPGTFTVTSKTSIEISSTNADANRVATFLSHAFATPTGYRPTVTRKATGNLIRFILLPSADRTLGDEGYKLLVTPNAVTLSANKPAGLFYGVQTILQLLPKEIESKKVVRNISWTIPAVEITDFPRFGWRGLMFDVSRHFFGKQDVERFIDDMVKYKYNLLHMHLTDDQGWRVEIKALPKLTSVGAWNVKKTGTFGEFSPPGPGEPRNFGGFYTQEDIKEIVQYAKDRFVNVLPEVDVPGHSLAAVASYPEISCTPEAVNYHVNSGESFMDWSHGAPPIALVDNTLCPANEKAYDFLDKVFTELAALFPFEYIHVGGDECPKNYWEKSDAIKALMQKEGLKTQEEVQSYFEKRVEKIIESKGKKVIGWDEILEGGLAPNAAVMSWRGINGGIQAAKMGHEVVMSPTTYTYLDYMQSDPATEPPVYATLRLKTAYEFEPVPPGVDARYIKGGQANLWTEQVYNMRHEQYMVWPRAFAIAEAVWSPKERRNWNGFVPRVEKQFERFDVAEKKYAPSMYDPSFKATKNANNEVVVEMETELEGLHIYYSFDNSFPDEFYPEYTQPLTVPKDASNLRVITYRNGKPLGRMITIPVSDLRRRAGMK